MNQELHRSIYVSNADIQKLLGVGYHKAKKIIIDIKKEVLDEGRELLYENKVPTKRVLRKFGLTRKDFE